MDTALTGMDTAWRNVEHSGISVCGTGTPVEHVASWFLDSGPCRAGHVHAVAAGMWLSVALDLISVTGMWGFKCV
jgi:hypothetical protein